MPMRSTEFINKLGISKKKLENLEKEGVITPIRKGRLKYYTDEMVDEYFGLESSNKKVSKKIIGYYRVSKNSQKEEMKYQKEALENFSINSGNPIDEYLSDIGSGIDFKRKNFLKIINMIEKREISELIITHKDRLTRFGFDLIEERCNVNNVKLTVINLEKSSPEKELIDELMDVLDIFSNRICDLRKYKKIIKGDLNDSKSED